MNAGPSENNPIELIQEILRMIRVGCRNERCEIKKGIITYHDSNIQALNLAISKFETTPNPGHFDNIQDALSICKQQGKQCFDYSAIESMFTTIAKLQSQHQPESKNRM